MLFSVINLVALVAIAGCAGATTSKVTVIETFAPLPEGYLVSDGGTDPGAILVATVDAAGTTSPDGRRELRRVARELGANVITRRAAADGYSLLRARELLRRYVWQAATFTAFCSNGETWVRTELRDGLPHGEHVVYDCQGKELARATFRQGTIWSGKVIGELGERMQYVDGVRQGGPTTGDQRLYVHIDGKLPTSPGVHQTTDATGRWVIPYDAQGRINGAQKHYKGGKLAARLEYVAGELDGVSRTYYESGRVHRETPYRHGLPHGLQRVFEDDGQLVSAVHFEDGLRHGPSKLALGWVYYWLGHKVGP